MGLKKWIQSIFNKSINTELAEDCLILLAKDNAKIKFGTKLDVKPNSVAILTYRNKVADLFSEGSYRLDTKIMPLLSRMQNMTKPNKKGKLPNTFKADIYYLNLLEFKNGRFLSTDYVVSKGFHYKKVKVKLAGTFSYKIISPVDFLEAMFTQFGIVRDKIAIDEIGNWVAHLVVKKVQKNKPQIDELYERNSKCFEGIVDYVNKEIYDCGIEVSQIDITETKFPKKIYKNVTLSYDELHQKPVKQFMGESKIGPNPVDKANQVSFEKQSQLVYKEEANQINEEVNTISTSVSSDGTMSPDIGRPNAVLLDSEKMANSDVYSNVSLNTKSETTDAVENDNVEPVIKKTITYKKCNNCGAFNPIDSKICFACKARFDK